MKLIKKVSTEILEMIQKLLKENQSIKKNIEDTKNSHAKTIDLKNSKVKNILKKLLSERQNSGTGVNSSL